MEWKELEILRGQINDIILKSYYFGENPWMKMIYENLIFLKGSDHDVEDENVEDFYFLLLVSLSTTSNSLKNY